MVQHPPQLLTIWSGHTFWYQFYLCPAPLRTVILCTILYSWKVLLSFSFFFLKASLYFSSDNFQTFNHLLLSFASTLLSIMSFPFLSCPLNLPTMSSHWLFTHLYSSFAASTRSLLLPNMGRGGQQPHPAVYFHLSSAAPPTGCHLVQRWQVL